MISFVQSGISSSLTSIFAQSISPLSNVASGDLLVVFGTSTSITAIPIITIADNLNNVYQQFGNTLTVAQGTIMWLFYAIASSSGSVVVTINYNIVMPNAVCTFAEWHAPFLSSTDGYAMRSNSFGPLLSTNYIATNNSNDLLLSTFFHAATNVVTPVPGWTQNAISSSLGYAWHEVLTTGVYRYSATQNTSAPWGAVLWAFPVGAPSGPSNITFNVTTSYLQGTSFKEVYANRIPEDIYDSLGNTPNFVYNKFGPTYGS